jgi:NitT/TauT family transport system permease protein
MNFRRLFAIRAPLTAAQELALKVSAFVLPLGVWCLVSYCPYVWHPMVRVTDGGGSSFLSPDMLIERQRFDEENAQLVRENKPLARGARSNPIFLPAPHEVGQAMYTAFTTPPLRRGDPWLHESIGHSLKIIFCGFSLAAIIGVPLGILCGTFGFFSRLTEPFVDFIRYMPAPAFGPLMVAIFGIEDQPKIAIIFIGTFFFMVLVVANTTRKLDASLLEAAQTLGARGRRLITRVILPGILPDLYNDLRIMIGASWMVLIVAELIGASSGISYFISQQGKYRHYEDVYAGIIIIGLIGLITDQVLGWLAPRLFPWTAEGARVKSWRLRARLIRVIEILGSRWDERLPWRSPSSPAAETATNRVRRSRFQTRRSMTSHVHSA